MTQFSSTYQPERNKKPKKKKKKKKTGRQNPPKSDDEIVKDPYKFTNVLEMIEYLVERQIPPVVINTITNEWNRKQEGVITKDEEKTLRLQFEMVLGFVNKKYDFAEFFAYCEEHAPGYLSEPDEERLPVLRDGST